MRPLGETTHGDRRTIGRFWNSWDGTIHLAEYSPCASPPRVYLCGRSGNFAAIGAKRERHECSECQRLRRFFQMVAPIGGCEGTLCEDMECLRHV